MSRRICDDELALRGSKVAIGYVYRNSLFTLSPQSIGQQGQINMLITSFTRAFLYCFQLVFKY